MKKAIIFLLCLYSLVYAKLPETGEKILYKNKEHKIYRLVIENDEEKAPVYFHIYSYHRIVRKEDAELKSVKLSVTREEIGTKLRWNTEKKMWVYKEKS